MTAHVDVVARAESRELSVQRLSDMIGKSQIPVRAEVAQSIADLWVSYQLLATAAAKGDSLSDSTLIDEVTRLVSEQRLNVERAFHEVSDKYIATLGSIDDEYLRERAADMRDVTSRVLHNLSGRQEESGLGRLDEPCIIIGHDLT